MIKLGIKEVDSWGKSNDELHEIFVKIENLAFKSQKAQNKFQENKNELLLLLRSKHQLEEASDALIEFVTFFYNENTGYPKDSTRKSHYAFLSYVSTLICSCFNQSAYREKKVPLHFIKDQIQNNPTYIEIKEIRDKRFSHQDKEHPVHTDKLTWRFEKKENIFGPSKPSYVYENLHALHRSRLNEWSNFISYLITKINEKVIEITKTINPLLSEIEITEKE